MREKYRLENPEDAAKKGSLGHDSESSDDEEDEDADDDQGGKPRTGSGGIRPMKQNINAQAAKPKGRPPSGSSQQLGRSELSGPAAAMVARRQQQGGMGSPNPM